MSRLKQLISEIHRRSLWQVLLVYLGVSWGVLEAAALFRDEFGLPGWLVSAALGLLIAGLVVVLVLAFVPEPATSPQEPHAVERSGAGRRHLLTWRRAATIFVVALAAWGVVATGWLVFGERGEMAPTGMRAVAVLPLENLSPDPDNEFFAAGIHEDILSQLAKIRALRVISRTSVLRYADTGKDIPTIAAELGVDGIVEGSVRREGNQIRVVLQLIDKADGHLWSETYDRDLTVANVFAIQSDIAEHIAQVLMTEITPAERETIEASPTDNLEAYDYYLRGLEYQNRGYAAQDLQAAEGLYLKAIELDPNFALAYARLSRIHDSMFWFFLDRTGERLRKGRDAAEAALRIDPDLAEAHLALGYYYYHGLREYGRASEELHLALRKKPNDSHIYYAIGAVERRQGRFSAAKDLFLESAALDPLSHVSMFEVGLCALYLGEYEAADRYSARAISLAPDIPESYLLRAWTYLAWKGDSAEASRMVRSALRTSGTLTSIVIDDQPWWLLRPLAGQLESELEAISGTSFGVDTLSYWMTKAELGARVGDRERAHAYFDSLRAATEERVQAWPGEARFHSLLGVAYAGLGRSELAIREGEFAAELLPPEKDALWGRAVAENLAWIYTTVGSYDAAVGVLEELLSGPTVTTVPFLRVDPLWDPLRDHPRFQALLEKHE